MDKATREGYVDIVNGMIEADSEYYEQCATIDRMVNTDYELPAKLKELDWMKTWRSTWPADAIRAGQTALSALEPRIRILPMGNKEEDRRMVNDWEKIVKWQMYLADLRRPVFRADIMGSSLRYGMIVGNVIHLPTQRLALKATKGKSAIRNRAVTRAGDYVISIKNPQSVHCEWSDLGLERVAYVVIMEAQQIVDFWGSKAGWLQRAIETGDVDRKENYVLVDYSDYDVRLVWCYKGDDTTTVEMGRQIIDWTNQYPYLNWIGVIGGTDLEQARERKANPLLATLVRSENWLTENLLRSMQASEGIVQFASPRLKRMGPNPRSVRGRYGIPGGTWDVPSLHDVQPMPRDGLDPAARELVAMFSAELERTTVSRVLMTSESMPGETYSGFNMRVQSALGQIMPYKLLGENFTTLAGINMVLQAHYTGHEIKGWVKKGPKSEGYWASIKPKDVDPEKLYMIVKYRADVPTDRQQVVNTALMMAKGLPVGMVQILEELGYDDPEEQMDEFEKDRLREAITQARTQRIMFENSGQMEQEVQKLAQAMVQNLMKQGSPTGTPGGPIEPQGPAPAGGIMPEGRMPPEGPTTPGVEGSEALAEGGNPAMGGQPVAQMNPGGATRESQQAMAEGAF
jgi:hypothetical protein